MFNWEIFFGVLSGSVAAAVFFLLFGLVGVLCAEQRYVWGILAGVTALLEVAIIVGFVG